MHSANVNQAIRMILVELYPIIPADHVAIFVCTSFSEKFLLLLARMASKSTVFT